MEYRSSNPFRFCHVSVHSKSVQIRQLFPRWTIVTYLFVFQDTGATDNTTTTAISGVMASYKSKASAIIVLTTSGATSHLVSKYKPHCPILTVTRFDQVARQLQLYRGCIPLLYEKPRPEGAWMDDVDARVQYAIDFGKQSKFISSGDNVVVITGWRQGSGSSNTVRIL